jgi:hypothetical protein
MPPVSGKLSQNSLLLYEIKVFAMPPVSGQLSQNGYCYMKVGIGYATCI